MTVLVGAHHVVDEIAGWPVINGILRRQYERVFETNREANLFRGVFESFEDAARSAPSTRPIGYDNPDSAAMYMDRTRRIYPTDYPVIFWLQKLLAEDCVRIFELGGHIGVSYYAYRRYLDYPDMLRWCVHDVPAVMEKGRLVATEKDRDGRLSFCDRFDDANGFDILAAQGSLQYLPDTLAERLAGLEAPPRYLLLNLTPLHERHSYFTLQSVGTAFCPYRITAAGEFLRSFEELGYALVDTWENPEKRCEIPFHPEFSLDRYYGFFFRRPA
jgi:putative methyltransferase (TIGR04325 family)